MKSENCKSDLKIGESKPWRVKAIWLVSMLPIMINVHSFQQCPPFSPSYLQTQQMSHRHRFLREAETWRMAISLINCSESHRPKPLAEVFLGDRSGQSSHNAMTCLTVEKLYHVVSMQKNNMHGRSL